MSRFYGMYRGVVKDNDDSGTDFPYRCRVKVYVPQVYGTNLVIPDELPWAEPCINMFGGSRVQVGEQRIGHGFIAIPPVEASVWVAFEQGDPQRPIWMGTWFGHKDLGVGQTELGDESKEDYPESCVLKPPYPPAQLGEEEVRKDGYYIRFKAGNTIEIVFHKDENYIALDGVNKKVVVHTKGFDVLVRSETINLGDNENPRPQGGNITLQAVPISYEDEENDIEWEYGGEITMSCRKFNMNCTGDMEIASAGTLLLQGAEKTVVASPVGIYGNSPAASGFDKHP